MASLIRQQNRADSIVDFFQANGRCLKQTLNHFKLQGINHMTIRRAVKRFEDTGSTKFKTITGRPRSATSANVIKKIDRQLKSNPQISQRELAKKTEVSPRTVSRIKDTLGYKSYRTQTAPKMVKDQEERIIRGATKIYKKLVPSGGAKILIIDDETYVPQDPTQVPGLSFYSQKKYQPVDDSFKFKSKTKFYKKFLVWQAIDQNGNVSEPFVYEGTINAKIYLEECLKKRLLPFILKHYVIEEVLFWPDMAKAHYASVCVDWLREQNLNFVDCKENTPNFPQGRPIEKFWALCKVEYGKRKRPVSSLVIFRRIWKNISDKVSEKSGKNLMSGIKKKLRSVREGGALAPIKIKLPLGNIINSNNL